MLNNNDEAGPSNTMSHGLPPSYEVATYDTGQSPSRNLFAIHAHILVGNKHPLDQKQPLPKPAPMMLGASPAPGVYNAPVPITRAGSVTVYHYIHPVTQQRIDSLLPPSHPEMQCLQHGHIPHTRFGIAGILAAIFWFPLGLGCLLIDKDTRCTRCKKVISGRFGAAP